MQYDRIESARFIARVSRFTAQINLGGQGVLCHIQNTGRLTGLLVADAPIYVQRTTGENRRTAYDLIAVETKNGLVNVDSNAPNRLFAEWFPSAGLYAYPVCLQREVRYLDSRLDFCFEAGATLGFAEVKGVTLVQNGIALFPDAPSVRAVRHIAALRHAKQAGHEAIAAFIVQREDITTLSPHDTMQPAFGSALRQAAGEGVHVLAVRCHVTPESIAVRDSIPIKL